MKQKIVIATLALGLVLLPVLSSLGVPKVNADSSGGKIAFLSYGDDPNGDIFTIDADGSNKVNITNDPSSDDEPIVSPDGEKVIIRSDRDALAGNQLYAIDIDGSNVTLLTSGSSFNAQVAWSPDSSKIVFVSNRDGNNEVYVMNADGSNQVNLSSSPNSDFRPKWSPDGSKIAFASDRDGNEEVYVMNADGSNQVNLSNSPASDLLPKWSPDGSKIAFETDRDVNVEIYVMNADGSNQANLSNSLGNDFSPQWSPDGSEIAFVTDRDGNNEVYVMNADGSNQVNLSNDGATDDFPLWSPDGNKIAFEANRDGNTEIYVMNADGSNQANLSNNGDYDTFAFWYTPALGGDSDGDGSSDAIEAGGPNGGDANNDGTADSTQANVTTLVNPVTGKYTSVVSTCATNQSVSIAAESSNFQDAAFTYPGGLVNFNLACAPGATSTMTMYFYGTFSGSLTARKYNSNTHVYQAVPGASISQTTIGGSPATKLAYQITDGSSLDQDGTVNGTIVDPVGLATAAVGAPDTGVGTQSTQPWNLMIVSILIGGLLHLTRRFQLTV